MYMQDVLAKLKDIAEKSDNRDINDAIKGAEMTQTVVAEKQEPTVDEVHEVIAEEEAVNEIPTSNEISDLLRLSGQSGVLGISQPSVIIKEAKADPKIVARFAKVKPSQRSYYIMKWAEENGIDSDDAMEMAGYERGGYMGAGAFKWKYVGEGLRVVPKTPGNQPVPGEPIAKPKTPKWPEKKPKVKEDEMVADVDLEETIEVPVTELADLLRLAGYSEVTEEEFEPVNAPKELYADAEEQLIAQSGGLNGPKTHYPAAAGGDNPMSVQPLDVTSESVYKKYIEFVSEENKSKATEAAKPDYIDLDGDGDKEESMKKAAEDKKKKAKTEGLRPVPKTPGNQPAPGEPKPKKKTVTWPGEKKAK